MVSQMQKTWWGLAVTTFGFFVALDLAKWIPLRFWGATSGEHFVDAKQILDSVKCLEENPYISSTELCNKYVYGRFLLKTLDILNLKSSQTTLIGFIFLGILAVVFAFVSFKSEIPISIYAAILLSPPVILLAERANFDILMVGFVVLSSILSWQGNQIGSTLSIAVSSLFKFYTIPLMFFQAWFARKPLVRALIILFAGVVTIYISKEILTTKILMNPSNGNTYNNGEGFGFNIWSGYLPRFEKFLPLNLGVAGYLISAGMLVIISFSTYLYFNSKDTSRVIGQLEIDHSFRTFEYLLIVHLSCFFAGVSIDYRQIFLIAATLSYLSAISHIENQELEKKSLVGLLLISIWCTFPSDGLQLIGDIALTILTLLLLEKLVRQRVLARKPLNK